MEAKDKAGQITPNKALRQRLVRERACAYGLGHYKHWLVRNGIIANADRDIPCAWQEAFKALRLA
jgi:hypothetical protein